MYTWRGWFTNVATCLARLPARIHKCHHSCNGHICAWQWQESWMVVSCGWHLDMGERLGTLLHTPLPLTLALGGSCSCMLFPDAILFLPYLGLAKRQYGTFGFDAKPGESLLSSLTRTGRSSKWLYGGNREVLCCPVQKNFFPEESERGTQAAICSWKSQSGKYSTDKGGTLSTCEESFKLVTSGNSPKLPSQRFLHLQIGAGWNVKTMVGVHFGQWCQRQQKGVESWSNSCVKNGVPEIANVMWLIIFLFRTMLPRRTD